MKQWEISPEAYLCDGDHIDIYEDGKLIATVYGRDSEAQHRARLIKQAPLVADALYQALMREREVKEQLLGAAKLAADTLDMLCDYMAEQNLAGHVTVREGALAGLNAAIEAVREECDAV